jgi:hypothetical protein
VATCHQCRGAKFVLNQLDQSVPCPSCQKATEQQPICKCGYAEDEHYASDCGAHEACEATIRILQQQSDREDEKVRRLEQHLEWAQHQSMADGIARDKAEASVRRLEQERERLTLEMETWKHGLRDFYTSRLAEVEQRLAEALQAYDHETLDS